MAGANLTSLSNILKEYYLGPVTEQLNNTVLLLSRLEAKSEDLVGKRAYVPLHHGRSTGVGARSESAPLPAAGKQDYDKAVYDLKYLYGRVEVTGPSMAKTKNEAGAFLQALKSELDGVRNDLKKDLARQVYGDGSGEIATVASATGQVITLKNDEALRKGQLYVGMALDVYTSTGGERYVGTNTSSSGSAGAIVISAINIATPSITVTGTITSVANNDVLVRAGLNISNATGTGSVMSWSDEIDGIQRIVSSATGGSAFGGIDPSATGYSWWDNQRVSPSTGTDVDSVRSGTQNLSFGVVQQAMNLVKIAGGNPSAIVTSLGVQREFYNLFQTQVRYIDPESLTYQQGFQTLMYNNMPVIADIDAPYGKMYILDESTLKVFSDQDWHFLDADGLTLRQVTGYDKFEAILARYMNMGATRRNNQCVINNILVDGAADAGY